MKRYLIAGLVVVVADARRRCAGARPLGMPEPRPADAPAARVLGRAGHGAARATSPRGRTPWARPRRRPCGGAIIAELDRLGLRLRGADRRGGLDAQRPRRRHGAQRRRPPARRGRRALGPARGALRLGRRVAGRRRRRVRGRGPPGDGARPARRPDRCATTSSFSSPTARSAACSARAPSSRGHPYAYRVGVVLNLDSPGTSSPLLMYETSPDNGRLVSEFLAAADRPYTSSLMYEVSRRSDILSDFQPFESIGFPGLSFGSLDGPPTTTRATTTSTTWTRRWCSIRGTPSSP